METEDTLSELKMPSGYRDLFRVFLRYLRNPSSDIPFTGSFSEKLRIFYKLFFPEVILAFTASILILVLNRLNLLPDHENISHVLPKNPGSLIAFLYIIIIGPIAEEFLFRFNLRLFQKYLSLQVILGALCVIYFVRCLGKSEIISLVSLSLALSFLIFYFTHRRKLDEAIEFIWANKFKLVFYITSVLFALAHLSNYGISLKVLLLSPILVLPQFIMGLFAGFIRLRLGLWWSCFFHSSHNLLVVMPFLVATIIARSEDYVVTISEVDQSCTPRLVMFTHDTIIIEAFTLKDAFSTFLKINSKEIYFLDQELEEKRISIRFEKTRHFPKPFQIPAEQIIISELLEQLHLGLIRKKEIRSKGYDLQIADSLKFSNFMINSSEGEKPYFTDYPDNQLRLNNAKLWEIARSLESIYRKGIYGSSAGKDIFTVTIPEMKFEDLSEFLSEKYGLILVESPVEKEVYRIWQQDKYKLEIDTLH